MKNTMKKIPVLMQLGFVLFAAGCGKARPLTSATTPAIAPTDAAMVTEATNTDTDVTPTAQEVATTVASAARVEATSTTTPGTSVSSSEQLVGKYEFYDGRMSLCLYRNGPAQFVGRVRGVRAVPTIGLKADPNYVATIRYNRTTGEFNGSHTSGNGCIVNGQGVYGFTSDYGFLDYVVTTLTSPNHCATPPRFIGRFIKASNSAGC